MKLLPKILVACAFLWTAILTAGPNQTDTLSPIYPENALPFTIQIAVADFSLPSGIQAYASASYGGKWLLLAGRTNGLHGFDNVGNNFPPTDQNRDVYVIDPGTGASWSRSLIGSGLSQDHIDNLSTTASQSFQKDNILYVVGGYGINTSTGEMETKSTLTSIDITKMMNWVINGSGSAASASQHISNPALQVTGGFLFQANDHQPMLLMLGQNFMGLYTDGSNGMYTQQIRQFWLRENGATLTIHSKPSTTTYPDYRRRDLNIVPTIHNNDFTYTAFAGVFTLDTGVWTVPITIFPDGTSYEPDPNDPNTFKQGMNHYNCPSFGLYSVRNKEMFVIFPGGISYGFFSGGVFTTDAEIPFINQVTTVKIDRNRNYTQFLMNDEYPFLVSTGTNPGNQLLFGAEAQFFPKDNIKLFSNGVIQLDTITSPTVIGHIVGGIMSTLPNTNSRADSTSSPYVFTVTLIPKTPS
ncbi:MAG: hypothetical protein Q8K75_05750 [Chlamydiales bacterium]|nr:hypothetical protein [Chlamydiales bacterium]